ncbi:hypothetical protein D3C79_1067910 [compost metagenome]
MLYHADFTVEEHLPHRVRCAFAVTNMHIAFVFPLLELIHELHAVRLIDGRYVV